MLELEALPTGGDGAWRGVPLARLLWQLPPAPLAALLEALLLERRVLVVSRDPGTVSTAAVAAAAALHPFAWHHIFVPLMPLGMKARTAHTSSLCSAGSCPSTVPHVQPCCDRCSNMHPRSQHKPWANAPATDAWSAAAQEYLTAPMPFLIGMCVTSLANLELDGVVVVDLDMGSVSTAACNGAGGATASKGGCVAELLPWAGCVAWVVVAALHIGTSCTIYTV